MNKNSLLILLTISMYAPYCMARSSTISVLNKRESCLSYHELDGKKIRIEGFAAYHDGKILFVPLFNAGCDSSIMEWDAELMGGIAVQNSLLKFVTNTAVLIEIEGEVFVNSKRLMPNGQIPPRDAYSVIFVNEIIKSKIIDVKDLYKTLSNFECCIEDNRIQKNQ